MSLASLLSACGSTSSSGEPVNLEFRAEKDLLDGFEQDSGFLPAGSPASIRVVAGATAGLVAAAQATAAGDTLTPVEGSGSLSIEAAFSLEISARIDAVGVEYEGVVETFEYGIDPAMTTFEPFSIGETVTLESALPPGELARVPIPSVPGATLVVDIAGGQLNTAYSGACAVAMDGLAQYTGEAVIDGTLALEGTIEIELGFVSESFGPFAIDVPIPATTTALDLGTLSTSDGMPADGSPCDGVSGDTDTSDPTVASGGTTGGDPTTSDPTTQTTEATTGEDSSSGGETSGTGTETGPETSSTGGVECVEDAECPMGEACADDECVPVPSECSEGLGCDVCPSAGSCSFCVQYDGNACGDEFSVCINDVDCLALVECTNVCGDGACVDACGMASTVEAIDLFNAVVTCINGACG